MKPLAVVAADKNSFSLILTLFAEIIPHAKIKSKILHFLD